MLVGDSGNDDTIISSLSVRLRAGDAQIVPSNRGFSTGHVEEATISNQCVDGSNFALEIETSKFAEILTEICPNLPARATSYVHSSEEFHLLQSNRHTAISAKPRGDDLSVNSPISKAIYQFVVCSVFAGCTHMRRVFILCGISVC